MQKIKRTNVRTTRGVGTFLKVILIIALSVIMIAAGYFAASYFSKIF